MADLMESVAALARELGFDEIGAAGVGPTDAPRGPVHPQAERLVPSPLEIMPEARSVILLAMGYRPFRARPGEASVDAYYIASNRAHENALILAQRLNGLGWRAVMTDRLRVKPLCAGVGFGSFGRNGLIAVGAHGTRVCLQTIVTDAPLAAPEPAGRTLDQRCLTCRACMSACPTGALRGDGSLDIEKCLRAQPENQPLPEGMRALTGNSLLGCDVCQRVCPRNACAAETDMPEALARALRLDRLIGGDYRPLQDWLGKNNARKLRLLSRAALAAANENRTDLLDGLKKLTGLPEPVASHAAWAVARLTGRTPD